MGIIWAIIVGFIVGLVARALMPGRDAAGFIVTTVLGIGGAIAGKFIGQGLGMYGEGDPAGFIMSVVGAMILLFIYHIIMRNKTSSP